MRLVVLVCVCMLMITACSSSNSDNDNTATSTPENTPQEIPVTEEATQEVDISVTEEATQVISNSPDGAYGIDVSYTTEAPDNDSFGVPPDGERWLIVVGTLRNDAGDTVTVNAEHLTLLDAQGNRYSPEAPDDSTQPPMVSAELAEGESVLGLVRFAIPEDVTPILLEWCPEGNCEPPLQAQIP